MNTDIKSFVEKIIEDEIIDASEYRELVERVCKDSVVDPDEKAQLDRIKQLLRDGKLKISHDVYKEHKTDEKKTPLFSNIKRDFISALILSIMAVPLSSTVGILAFASLGTEYTSVGIMAGLIGTVFLTLIVPFFGKAPLIVMGINPMTALIISDFISDLPSDIGVESVIPLVFLVICLAGIVQLVFGLLKLGNLIKFIPYPVIAGLITGGGILIILKQLNILLGVPLETDYIDLILNPGAIQHLTLLVGLITYISAQLAHCCHKFKIPGPFIGLCAGTAIYYLFLCFFNSDLLCGTLAPITSGEIRTLTYFSGFIKIFTYENNSQILWHLVPYVLIIAVLSSMRSLFTASMVNIKLKTHTKENSILIGQGIGDALSGVFGGLSGVASLSGTLLNHNSGGKTLISPIIRSGMILGIVFLIPSIISKLPVVVISGILIFMSVYMMDKWSLRLFKSLFRSETSHKPEIIKNLAIVVLVILSVIFIGFMEAIGIGILLACFFFIVNMRKSVIRSSKTGKQIRSSKKRPNQVNNILQKHGNRIRFYKLEGILFFGTGEELNQTIEKHIKGKDGAKYIIFDMKHIQYIDSKGAQLLNEVKQLVSYKKGRIAFSGLSKGEKLWSVLTSIGFSHLLEKNPCFNDSNAALEWAEDELIEDCMSKDVLEFLSQQSEETKLSQWLCDPM